MEYKVLLEYYLVHQFIGHYLFLIFQLLFLSLLELWVLQNSYIQYDKQIIEKYFSVKSINK
jgi:hypothetical protein